MTSTIGGAKAIEVRVTIERQVARLSDLARVLIRPVSTFAKPRSSKDAAKLFLLLLAIDFMLSIVLLPNFAHYIAVAFANKGPISVQMRVTTLAFALISGTVANALIVSMTAVLFFLARVILVGRSSFAETVSALLIASAPVLLNRVIRVVGYALGLLSDPLRDPFSFARLGWLHGQSGWSRGLGFLSLFDLWTFALVVLGFHIAARMRWFYSIPVSVLLWGGLQALLLRLQIDGVLGS